MAVRSLAPLIAFALLPSLAAPQKRVSVVADSAVVAERQARTGGHQARFTVTNHGPTKDTFHVGCVGLARVRCMGTSVTELTLGPGASDVVTASYTVTDAGRGQVRVTVFSPGTRARGSGATVVPVRQ